MLWRKLNSNLSFKYRTTNLCEKASHKLLALARISNCIHWNKSRSLIKSFITYQFSCSLLIWMFGSSQKQEPKALNLWGLTCLAFWVFKHPVNFKGTNGLQKKRIQIKRMQMKPTVNVKRNLNVKHY